MKRIILGILALGMAGTTLAFPWLADGENVRGAKFLSQSERQAHVARLLSMKTLAECHDYMAAHNRLVDERAAAQNVQLPPMQGDPCGVMKGMGRIQ